jgi:hypothetical protein
VPSLALVRVASATPPSGGTLATTLALAEVAAPTPTLPTPTTLLTS